MGISALITGVTGSAGSYMADFLTQNKSGEVAAFGISRWHSTSGNHNLSNSKEKVSLFDCDLLDLSAVIRTLSQIKPDVIFHFASHANVLLSFHNPLSVVDNNVRSTLNLLEALRILNLKPVVVAASTSEVYGKISLDDTPINENLIMRPMSPYGASKAFQDHIELVYFEAFKIPIIRTRMFTYVNARRGDLFATSWARQIVDIERGKRRTLKHGNLESIRTLLDVRDAMEAYWLAFLKGRPGEAYNVGGTQSVKVGDVLSYLIAQSTADINTELDPALIRPSDVTLQIPDCTKFMSETGWSPKYDVNSSLDFLLRETRENYNKQRAVSN
jgi:GDP-mannose 4,6-dehydratase